MAGKKEFDKDYIFNLIMPSSVKADTDSPAPTPTAAVPSAVSPAPQQAPTAAEEPEDDALSQLKNKLASRQGGNVSLPRSQREYTLVNLTELLVCDRIDSVFAKFNCCRCDKCRKDVTAAALNMLPAEYVVAPPEEIFRMVEDHTSQEVSSALVKAVLQIRAKPRH